MLEGHPHTSAREIKVTWLSTYIRNVIFRGVWLREAPLFLVVRWTKNCWNCSSSTTLKTRVTSNQTKWYVKWWHKEHGSIERGGQKDPYSYLSGAFTVEGTVKPTEAQEFTILGGAVTRQEDISRLEWRHAYRGSRYTANTHIHISFPKCYYHLASY